MLDTIRAAQQAGPRVLRGCPQEVPPDGGTALCGGWGNSPASHAPARQQNGGDSKGVASGTRGGLLFSLLGSSAPHHESTFPVCLSICLSSIIHLSIYLSFISLSLSLSASLSPPLSICLFQFLFFSPTLFCYLTLSPHPSLSISLCSSFSPSPLFHLSVSFSPSHPSHLSSVSLSLSPFSFLPLSASFSLSPSPPPHSPCHSLCSSLLLPLQQGAEVPADSIHALSSSV